MQCACVRARMNSYMHACLRAFLPPIYAYMCAFRKVFVSAWLHVYIMPACLSYLHVQTYVPMFAMMLVRWPTFMHTRMQTLMPNNAYII